MRFPFRFWCDWTKWTHWVNLWFYLFGSDVHLVKWGKETSPRFILLHQGLESFLSDLLLARWHNLVCMCSHLWLVFARLEVDTTLGVGFKNTCIVSGKWNVSTIIPTLYGWVYKPLRLYPLVIDHSAVVGLWVPTQDDPRLNPMVSQFLISVLSNLCSESARA